MSWTVERKSEYVTEYVYLKMGKLIVNTKNNTIQVLNEGKQVNFLELGNHFRYKTVENQMKSVESSINRILQD